MKRRAVRRLEEHAYPYAVLMGTLPREPVRPLRGGLKRRAVRRLGEHAYPYAVLMGTLPREPVHPLRGGLKRCAVCRLEEHAYPYAVLMGTLQREPACPLRGGLRRRAVRRLAEHTYPVCRAGGHAAVRAGAPHEGRLEEARGAPFRRACIPYAVLVGQQQRVPVRPMRGGLKRRAVRRLKSTRIRTPCWWASCSVCRCAPCGAA